MKVLLLLPRRIGRVVDCGSLENYCTERYRGFESLILRERKKLPIREAFFVLGTLVKIGEQPLPESFTVFCAK